MKRLLCLVFALGLLIAWAAPATAGHKTFRQYDPQYRLFSVQSLHNEYEANELAADQKYKGKVIEVSGSVKEVSKGLFGQPVVVLYSPETTGTVHCTFPKELIPRLAELLKDQFIVVRGVCKGMMIVSIGLNECDFQ